MPTVLSVTDFGALPDGRDCTAALGRAASACRGLRDATVLLPPGRYAIAPERAAETWAGVSNHEPSVARRVALLLSGCHGVTVDARGATLVARGHVVPLWLDGGADITVRGLTIDWATPLHGWAACVGAWSGWMDLRVIGGSSWRIIRERLCFLVDGVPEEMNGAYSVDPDGMVPAERSGDNCGSAFTIPWQAEALDGGLVRVRAHLATPPASGHLVILRHGKRIAPAIVASGVAGVRLEELEIRQAGGMAIIVQRCSDPQLINVRVVAGESRPLSANHDATHFVSCRGTVRLHRCILERQLDDGTNIHGINLPIAERIDARTLIARLAHPEQRGCVAGVDGERFAVIDQRSLASRAELTAARVRALNAEYVEITATGMLPDEARPGCALESMDADAGAEVLDCVIAHNRARGLIFSTRGKVRVERCHFVSPGPAIQLHGDGRSWHESGAVPETIISGNRFERCGYAREPRWGGGVVLVEPEIAQPQAPYHGSLVLADNRFEGCLLPAVKATALAALTVRANRGLAGPGQILATACGTVSSDIA